jgi:hypothetical protein
MGVILSGQRKGGPAGRAGAKALHVRGFKFENTAAKFWTCLWDEVAADFPPHTVIELSALCGGLLAPDLLVPANSLQRDIEQLDAESARDAFNDALAALAIVGPPPTVLLRLIPPPEAGSSHEMTLDCLDAEILPFLLVWLLEWASVPDTAWNEEAVRGHVAGQDRERGFQYGVSFEIHTRHVSEGLYHRNAMLCFRREAREGITDLDGP